MSTWDKIWIKHPICYYPPIWEALIDRVTPIEQLKDIVTTDPRLTPEAMTSYFKKRIVIVNKLVETKKLDARLGKMAVAHFNSHLQELEALRMK